MNNFSRLSTTASGQQSLRMERSHSLFPLWKQSKWTPSYSFSEIFILPYLNMNVNKMIEWRIDDGWVEFIVLIMVNMYAGDLRFAPPFRTSCLFSSVRSFVWKGGAKRNFLMYALSLSWSTEEIFFWHFSRLNSIDYSSPFVWLKFFPHLGWEIIDLTWLASSKIWDTWSTILHSLIEFNLFKTNDCHLTLSVSTHVKIFMRKN
jgi:hypothetical protein